MKSPRPQEGRHQEASSCSGTLKTSPRLWQNSFFRQPDFIPSCVASWRDGLWFEMSKTKLRRSWPVFGASKDRLRVLSHHFQRRTLCFPARSVNTFSVNSFRAARWDEGRTRRSSSPYAPGEAGGQRSHRGCQRTLSERLPPGCLQRPV